MQSEKRQNDLCSSPRQTIQYHSYPSLCPTSNAEEAEVERFCEDLQDLLELTPKKDVLFVPATKALVCVHRGKRESTKLPAASTVFL